MCQMWEGRWMATEWEEVEERRRRLWHTEGWSSGCWHPEDERSSTPRIRSRVWIRLSCTRRRRRQPFQLLPQESAASGAAPIIPAHFLARCRGGRGGDKEWGEADKWPAGWGGGDSRVVPFVQSLDVPLFRCHGSAQKKRREKRREIAATRKFTSWAESDKPTTGERSSIVSGRVQSSSLRNWTHYIGVISLYLRRSTVLCLWQCANSHYITAIVVLVYSIMCCTVVTSINCKSTIVLNKIPLLLPDCGKFAKKKQKLKCKKIMILIIKKFKLYQAGK